MRTISLLLSYVLFPFLLAAQQEISVISGQVFYYPQASAKPVLKIAGTQFELKGRLRCKGSESAKLVYNGHYFWVSGPKIRNVQDVVDAAVRSSEMSFTGRFFNFLTESLKESDNPENVKKYHRKYMQKTSGGIKGYADPQFVIQPLLIASGKLPAANVIFKWRQSSGTGPYTFSLLNLKNESIAQLLVRDTALTLNLEELALNLDEEYTWIISQGEKDHSVPMPFEVCPGSVVERQSDLSAEQVFQKASPLEQQLMLAYKLEEEHCFYGANQVYLKQFDKDQNNLLLRKMYTAFLARMDMLPEASSIIANTPK